MFVSAQRRVKEPLWPSRLPGDAAGNHGSGGRYAVLCEGGLTEEEE